MGGVVGEGLGEGEGVCVRERVWVGEGLGEEECG